MKVIAVVCSLANDMFWQQLIVWIWSHCVYLMFWQCECRCPNINFMLFVMKICFVAMTGALYVSVSGTKHCRWIVISCRAMIQLLMPLSQGLSSIMAIIEDQYLAKMISRWWNYNQRSCTLVNYFSFTKVIQLYYIVRLFQFENRWCFAHLSADFNRNKK